ncbi:hypothetical protein A3E86_01785 [Candidatus Daviesbacteria bacterium RIFCSPHIGHO2_12_FULL_47_45]|nr:MAG: hypothetical protein A3E86_01785 [Candidatus Daviesbacteria bacterium RIFCSPHIGHO2_12_FULL_47_45]
MIQLEKFKMQKNGKLTRWEWVALSQGYNIADGHAHHDQGRNYSKIIKKLSSIFSLAESQNQNQIQAEFEHFFFYLAGQKSYNKLNRPLYHYSCSLSIEVVANYFRKHKKTVALLHPTFDNLAAILLRHNIKLVPIEESQMLHDISYIETINADVLFLVCPNNPTGNELGRDNFKKIVEIAARKKQLLVIDFSFRFFSSYINWDQYKLLHESKVDFIVLEDTGKTWPSLDVKIGTMISSNSLYPELRDITDDFLLNVSPFVFKLISEYVQADIKKGSIRARAIVEENREVLRSVLKKSKLKVTNKNSALSVEWLGLPPGKNGEQLTEYLNQKSIHILPGAPFYWNTPSGGDGYIRVALLRPAKEFKIMALKFAKEVENYYTTV